MKNRLRVVVASFANAIVANSVAGAAYWGARLPAVRRYVIPNGLPLDEIAATAPAVESGGRTIVFSGRLDEGKNVVTFLEAVRRMDTALDGRALVCGDGPQRGEAETFIVNHGLGARVRVLGFVPNLWGVLKRAAVFVSPSRFEGSPNAVLEAMACGCPLVVSDIASHREILDDGSAVFVNGEDPDALARAVEGVLRDGDGARRRAARARECAQRHAMPLVADLYLQVYDEVLGAGARGRHQVVT